MWTEVICATSKLMHTNGILDVLHVFSPLLAWCRWAQLSWEPHLEAGDYSQSRMKIHATWGLLAVSDEPPRVVGRNLFSTLRCVRNIHLLFYLNKIKPESKSRCHPIRLLENAILAFIKASTQSLQVWHFCCFPVLFVTHLVSLKAPVHETQTPWAPQRAIMSLISPGPSTSCFCPTSAPISNFLFLLLSSLQKPSLPLSLCEFWDRQNYHLTKGRWSQWL